MDSVKSRARQEELHHMPATVIGHPDHLLDMVGHQLGHTDWLSIDQARINGFADATGDHQWIHVDEAKAAEESPFGRTIAHGFLTLSLCSMFLPQLVDVQNISMGVNYGLNKTRFPAPVPVGARIRASAEIAEAVEVRGGVQVIYRLFIEVDGGEKPACVVEWICRYLR